MKLKNAETRLSQGLEYAFGQENLIKTFSFAILAYLIIVSISAPTYITQIFSQDIQNGLAIFKTVLSVHIETSGIVFPALLSLLFGINLTNLLTSAKSNKDTKGSLTAIIPSLIAAGCGSCGIGILAIVGLAGAVSILPFGGSELYILGSLLLVYSIIDIGNPKTCDV
ncbi:MAG: hypothetical protein ACI977_000120 [Candidatus Nanohaloarchaea archaeon]|jgi:hypothetical protein